MPTSGLMGPGLHFTVDAIAGKPCDECAGSDFALLVGRVLATKLEVVALRIERDRVQATIGLPRGEKVTPEMVDAITARFEAACDGRDLSREEREGEAAERTYQVQQLNADGAVIADVRGVKRIEIDNIAVHADVLKAIASDTGKGILIDAIRKTQATRERIAQERYEDVLAAGLAEREIAREDQERANIADDRIVAESVLAKRLCHESGELPTLAKAEQILDEVNLIGFVDRRHREKSCAAVRIEPQTHMTGGAGYYVHCRCGGGWSFRADEIARFPKLDIAGAILSVLAEETPSTTWQRLGSGPLHWSQNLHPSEREWAEGRPDRDALLKDRDRLRAERNDEINRYSLRAHYAAVTGPAAPNGDIAKATLLDEYADLRDEVEQVRRYVWSRSNGRTAILVEVEQRLRAALNRSTEPPGPAREVWVVFERDFAEFQGVRGVFSTEAAAEAFAERLPDHEVAGPFALDRPAPLAERLAHEEMVRVRDYERLVASGLSDAEARGTVWPATYPQNPQGNPQAGQTQHGDHGTGQKTIEEARASFDERFKAASASPPSMEGNPFVGNLSAMGQEQPGWTPDAAQREFAAEYARHGGEAVLYPYLLAHPLILRRLHLNGIPERDGSDHYDGWLAELRHIADYARVWVRGPSEPANCDYAIETSDGHWGALHDEIVLNTTMGAAIVHPWASLYEREKACDRIVSAARRFGLSESYIATWLLHVAKAAEGTPLEAEGGTLARHPGEYVEPVRYDAEQRPIGVNHVAVVDKDRAPADCTVRDIPGEPGEKRTVTFHDETLKASGRYFPGYRMNPDGSQGEQNGLAFCIGDGWVTLPGLATDEIPKGSKVDLEPSTGNVRRSK